MHSDFDDDEFDDESEDLAEFSETPRTKTRTLTKLQQLKNTSYVLCLNSDAQSVVAVGGLGRDLFALSDNGASLSFQEIESGGPGLRDAHIDGDRIVVCGEYGHVAISHDKGKSFEKVDVNAGSSCMHGARTDATGALWLVGDKGVLIRSEDWKTFRHLQTDTTANLGRIRRYSQGMLMASSDGGLYTVANGQVTRTALFENAIINTPLETPKGAFMAVGQHGTVMRSDDAGDSYDPVDGLDIGKTGLSTITVMKDNSIALVGMSGLLAISKDDGKTFSKIEHDVTHDAFWSCMAWNNGLLIGSAAGGVYFYG